MYPHIYLTGTSWYYAGVGFLSHVLESGVSLMHAYTYLLTFEYHRKKN